MSAHAATVIHESFSLFFQPIDPAASYVAPVTDVPVINPLTAALIAPSVPASSAPVTAPLIDAPLIPSASQGIPSLTESCLRKRAVHEVAHGVPYSEQKRFKMGSS
jgi:hypothetical protein